MSAAFRISIALRSRGFDSPTRIHEIGHKYGFSCFRASGQRAARVVRERRNIVRPV